jgi:ParB family chromosome partitioning protein
MAYARLADTFGLSHQAIALRVGKARPTISNAIRLLGLSPAVQAKVAEGRITASHGRALVVLQDPAEQERFALEVERTGLNPVQFEQRLQEHLAQVDPGRSRIHKRIARDLDPDDEALRAGIQAVVGLPVTMRRRGAGLGGELVITFADDRDLNDLYERLGAPPL